MNKLSMVSIMIIPAAKSTGSVATAGTRAVWRGTLCQPGQQATSVAVSKSEARTARRPEHLDRVFDAP